MMRSLFSAVSGLKSHQTAMDVIGNNIANVNTIAYKSSRTVFQDIYSQTVSSATAPTATTGGINAKQVGLGTQIASIGMNMTEGSPQTTSYPLDFAISGEGFFVVDNGTGTYVYTRNGEFGTDAQGYLVNANGDYIMVVAEDRADPADPADPDDSNIGNGASVVDATTGEPLFGKIQLLGEVERTADAVTVRSEYAIDSNGVITATEKVTDLATGEVTTSLVTIGRMVLATFENSAGLEKIGSSYYKESANSGDADFDFAGYNCGSLNSGCLEMSNVELATELTNMIIMQRGFQANSRVITTSDSMLEELINLKR